MGSDPQSYLQQQHGAEHASCREEVEELQEKIDWLRDALTTRYRNRKTSGAVQAVRWDGNPSLADGLFGEAYGDDWEFLPYSLSIRIPGQEQPCRVGDWLIQSPRTDEWCSLEHVPFNQQYDLLSRPHD